MRLSALNNLILLSLVAPARVSALFHTDHSWLWGWAWGADSTVSVVDRFPPISFLARPASFGMELIDPLLGYVIPLNTFTAQCPDDDDDQKSNSTSTLGWRSRPNTGCPKLCIVGPHVPEGIESWIALVQRGSCQFADKAREAQRLGAKGLVVGGDDPELHGNPDALVNMYSPEDASDVLIPSVFIKYSDYMVLASIIARSNTSHSGLQTLPLLLSSEYSAWQWPFLTFLTILFIPSSLTFMTLLIHRIRAARAAQRDRAPEDLVLRFPIRIWTGKTWEKPADVPQLDPQNPQNAEGLDLELGEAHAGPPDASPTPDDDDDDDPAWFLSQDECAICLEQFAKGDRVRVLPCKHIFHLEEVDLWLIDRKKVCPVCKADVTHPHPTPPKLPSTPADTDNTHNSHDNSVAATPDVATERTPLLNANLRSD
ncbi:hypothetical protein EWM64_g3192 [Hericium alpestre]|uniref:RING-type E3 ubiquitin transferase n=1 Tax=Hericium alpestre TaxID=135208 RepID=A0A4Z0A560_9AGAM|nr:hypothetical protein EWM64_g3192 [Hericium alpestre]